MLLLKNGKIFTMENDRVIYGDVLIDDGKIVKVDHNINVPGAKEINLKNQIVMPGLIDGTTHMGLIETGKKPEDSSTNERDILITPHLKTKYGLYTWDQSFEEAAKHGVTTVIVSSGDANVIGSQSCAVKTKCASINKILISSCVDIKAVLGDEPKKWNYNKQETPLSRMGIVHLLRKTLSNAKKYIEKKEIDCAHYDLKYEAIGKVLKRECPLKITAHKAQDILTAVEIGKAFDINIIIDHATEAHMVIEEIKRANVSVFLDSCLGDKSNYKLQNRRMDNAKILSMEGIPTSIVTHHPTIPSCFLALSAAVAAKEGMLYEEALKAITINPAKSLGLDNVIGSIKEGKDADIVIFNNDPLKSMSKVIMTIIDGKIVYEC